jgi:hypothetical protein
MYTFNWKLILWKWLNIQMNGKNVGIVL